MRILIFTKGDRQLASSRVRAHLVADYLRTIGIDAESYHVKTRPWWKLSIERLKECWQNLQLLLSLRHGDVLYVQRAIYQLDFLIMVLIRRFLGGQYVFDFDDAIFLEKGHVKEKLNLALRFASMVIVCNDFLRDYSLRYNKNVFVIPSSLNTEHIYVPNPNPRSGRIKIGWTGTPGHYENVKLLLTPLQRLVDEGYPIEFVQVGGGEQINQLLASVKGLSLTFVSKLAWDDPRQVASYVREFDIGVTPLQKTEFNRGKDAGKTKEYLACKVAVIASNWGANANVITSGVNGLLVDTEEDWYQAFKRLVTDEPYRMKIAEEGRRYIENTNSFKVMMPKLLGLLKETRIQETKR